MLCYLDRTFCVSKNCTNKCGRKLTKEIEIEANLWWTNSFKGRDGQAPIACSYFCGEDEPEETKDAE